jgi:hypothetical protein
MDYAAESDSIARGIPDDDACGIATIVDLLEDSPQDLSVLTQEVGAPAATLACREPDTIGGTRVSYGLADILFPVTPPKPKGARLVRGPLRFN